MTKWQVRLLKSLGISPNIPEAKDALSGQTKHGRQRVRPKDCKRKTKRKMAKASRKRNRK